MLLPNSVRFGQPCAELLVHIQWCGQPKSVNMIPRGDRLHMAETRVLKPTSQHNMAIEPIRSRCNLRK
jgi:hypothetical protein